MSELGDGRSRSQSGDTWGPEPETEDGASQCQSVRASSERRDGRSCRQTLQHHVNTRNKFQKFSTYIWTKLNRGKANFELCIPTERTGELSSVLSAPLIQFTSCFYFGKKNFGLLQVVKEQSLVS